MEWTEETALKLIDVYKRKCLLWNSKEQDHFKKPLRENAWQEIAVEMNVPAEDCKRKMVSLLASYRREKSKIRKSKHEGIGKLYLKYK